MNTESMPEDMNEKRLMTTIIIKEDSLFYGGLEKQIGYRQFQEVAKNTNTIKFKDIKHTLNVRALDDVTVEIYTTIDNVTKFIRINVEHAKTIVRSIRNAMCCWAHVNYKSASYINVKQYIISVYDEKVNRYYTSVYEGNKYLLMNSIQKLNQVILNIEETFDAEVTHSIMIDFGSIIEIE